MASNHKASLLDIDLNVELTYPETSTPNTNLEDAQQQNVRELHHLPDLNINAAASFDIDLNTTPNSSTMSFAAQFSFDLNMQTYDTSLGANITGQNEMENEVREENDRHNNDAREENGTSFGNVNNGGINLEQSEVRRKKTTMSNAQRRIIYEALLEKSVDGKLKKGVTKLVTLKFSVPIHTVQRIWKAAENKGVHADVSNKMIGNCGRKRVQLDVGRFRDIPLGKRTTIRSLAYALNMSTGTLSRRLKEKEIRRHSNAINPSLTEENKRARLRFCISMFDNASITHDSIFSRMYNIVHIDEKWFYMTKKSKNYYLLPDEEEPIRSCKSKNFIAKVMFLVAIARPRFDAEGHERFSGKIGIWPFVTREPAKRTSVNRVAGTLETKPIHSVTKEVIRTYLLEKVLPTVKEKWPTEDRGLPIFIQQDNAKPHIDCEDDEFF